MNTQLTIASARNPNNRGQRHVDVSAAGVRVSVVSAGFLCLWACVFFAGCAEAIRPTEVPVWELANAELVVPRVIGRTRVGFDRPLSDDVHQPLCEEFSLVLVRTASQWRQLRRQLGLPPLPPEASLTRGAIVGVLASVGEAAGGNWPIEIRQTRVRNGEGWIEAAFSSGIYHPLRTAAYLELVYVPGLDAVRMVKIEHRSFIIRPPS